jgi:hypothetical protein
VSVQLLEARKAEFLSGLQSKADATGTVGTGTFLRGVYDYFREIARAQVDTETERDAIKDMILAAADQFVAGRYEWGWKLVRAMIDKEIDERMDALPDLLAAA